ncbi:MAG TPA: TylF/MycF/NovP-related O-methyltransferase [Casimicrobiaceae bacterium]|nr:TylF/MycF/NovP-related O-methyltransferase [Casimicrobiaceae bacterium]
MASVNVERLFDPSSYPIGVDHGRDIGAGYLRGWGLEFGGMFEKRVERDPVFREALEYATRRGTLVTRHKLANIFLILKYGWSDLDGDIFEFGSYRGGSAAFIAGVVRALGRHTRVYACDTFEGLPQANEARDLHRAGDFRDADLAGFREFIRAEGLEGRLVPVQGLFEQVLPSVLSSRPSMAMVHIDCDLYEPIAYLLAACEAHYEAGGYLVLDDPLFSSCIGAFDAMAEHLLRERRLLPEQIYPHPVFRPRGVAALRAARPL